MERARLIYEQIEEAKRHLLGGSHLQLRLALILLDNAAELLMHRELRDEFARADYYQPKWEPALGDWLRSGLGPKYTEKERRDSEREFEPKIRILQLRLKRISESDRRVLCVCHKLRCEAFHRGHVRSQILAHICKLLYLTVAELTVKLPVKVYSVPGGDQDKESAAFLGRFGVKDPYAFGSEERNGSLRNKLVENIAFDAAESARALSDDLVGRIDTTIEGLAYVGETEDRSKIDYNMQYGQFWHDVGAHLMEEGTLEPELGEQFKAWQSAGRARFTLAKVTRWRRTAVAIARCTNPANALDHYWAIDKRFARLEQGVGKSVAEYDEWINMEIHHRR